MIKPPTYPARPTSGGPFDKARPKHGDWAYELKYNGWRTLIHGPTGQMWNRHLKPLSIQKEFTVALEELREVSCKSGLQWWDCEALERRHDFARGSLIVLDSVVPERTYAERQAILSLYLPPIDCFKLGTDELVRTGYSDGGFLWNFVPVINYVRPDFVEGLVAKRCDSEYPFQLRSATKEFPFWIKHRVHF